MSRNAAEVFREAGKQYLTAGAKQLAAFTESLPTKGDRSRFFDAARAFLSFDGEIQRLSPGRRKAVLGGEGSELATALWEAAKRLLSEDLPSENSGLDIQLFGARVLMAELIIGGLQDASDKKALIDAALQLRELRDYAALVRSKRGGKTARQEALDDSSAQRAQRAARLETEVKKLGETTKQQPKRNRARHLNRRMGADKWQTADALVEFARRNNIQI